MAYRFTNTDKWADAWFSELKPYEKLVFMYLCDNCDMAGFIEFTPKKWAFDIGFDISDVLVSLEGLERGLIYSESRDCIFLRNFLKHQKNLPLNEDNNAHKGVIKRFDEYKIKFKIENIQSFINQEVKPLTRGYGNGNGLGSGLGISKIDNFQSSIDELKTIVLNDQMQLEALCMSHKIQPPKANQLIDDFCIYLKSTGEVKKDEKDFKRHLSNWMGTTLAKEKQANKNHQQNDYNPASKLF